MTSFISLLCIVTALGSIALVNTFAYALNKKWSAKVSDVIADYFAPLIFSILSAYKHFHFKGYRDHKNELPEQYMILSNHQSLLDIPVYMRFLRKVPLRFVAKKELSDNIPLVSTMLKASQHAMIPRTSPAAAMKVLDDFAVRVKDNKWIPVLFPEGTRSKDGNLGPFYAAGFRRMMEKLPLPVVVCALDGGWKLSGLKGIALHLHHGSYRVKILKIYPAPSGKKEQMAILDESKLLIQTQLDEWRAEDEAQAKKLTSLK